MSYRPVGQWEELVSSVVSPLASGVAQGVVQGGASVLQNAMAPKPQPVEKKTDYTPYIIGGVALLALAAVVWSATRD